MIVDSALNLMINDIFFKLDNFIPSTPIYLKLEGFNSTGSIKLKPALQMIDSLEKHQILKPGGEVIESSSGNLGIALSLICKIKGYKFICVSDPNISPTKKRLIELLGAKLVIIKERDKNGGYLASRIKWIKDYLLKNSHCVWTNQYANLDNILAHYHGTASVIHKHFPHIDFLFVGAGTTGTLMGCIQYFRKHAPHTRIIAVDAHGSVTFGGTPATRHIPGLGTSRKPEIADISLVNDYITITETETITTCYQILNQYGLLLGGSTGTILNAIKYYQDEIKPQHTVVAISPDFGTTYLDTIYNPEWLTANFPNQNVSIELINHNYQTFI